MSEAGEEGFDFGVGMLVRVLGKDEPEHRVVLNTVGPLWDGNEVWLLVAGGATFAAFPEWYATLFSGFYLPLLLIMVALIVPTIGIACAAVAVDTGTWYVDPHYRDDTEDQAHADAHQPT